jgi:hypothetical protein
VPQHLEANRHHAPLLDQLPEEVRLELCAEEIIYPNQTASTSHLRVEDVAHWRAAVKLKAAGSNDLTRYVYPKHVSTDGVQPSDFVPFLRYSSKSTASVSAPMQSPMESSPTRTGLALSHRL